MSRKTVFPCLTRKYNKILFVFGFFSINSFQLWSMYKMHLKILEKTTQGWQALYGLYHKKDAYTYTFIIKFLLSVLWQQEWIRIHFILKQQIRLKWKPNFNGTTAQELTFAGVAEGHFLTRVIWRRQGSPEFSVVAETSRRHIPYHFPLSAS